MKKASSYLLAPLAALALLLMGHLSCGGGNSWVNPGGGDDPSPSGGAKGVYVAGCMGHSDSNPSYPATYATLWKDGVPQQLSSTDSRAYSVYVSGSDVYVAGGENNRSVLWKNGTRQQLSNDDSRAYSVYVSGSDVYVVGGEAYSSNNRRSVLWKNGVIQLLGQTPSAGSYVYVSGNDVYVALGNPLGFGRGTTDLIPQGNNRSSHNALSWR